MEEGTTIGMAVLQAIEHTKHEEDLQWFIDILNELPMGIMDEEIEEPSDPFDLLGLMIGIGLKRIDLLIWALKAQTLVGMNTSGGINGRN
jgi:hypothetical protein